MQPIWLISFAIASLLLRAGFALQTLGSLQAKNSAAVVVRLLAETAASVLVFWLVGFPILLQKHSSWIGFDANLIAGRSPLLAAREFFYIAICLIGPAIVSGAIAERSKFYVGVVCAAILSGIVFPVAGHLVWYGKLRELGFIDFGGATVIHLSAAIFAAMGIAVLGSRAGKYDKNTDIAGHSLPLMGIGVLLLFAGWFPYLLGCGYAHYAVPSQWDDVIAGITAINTMLAGMGGVVGGLMYSHRRYGKPDLFFVFSGFLGGLVAVTSGLVAVNSIGAILIGVVAGILVPKVADALDTSAHLDDPTGLVAIHGVGAIWGTLATAFFIPFDNPVDHLKQLAIQSGGLAVLMLFSGVIASVLFILLRRLNWLRINPAEETDGLDLAEHSVQAYPEFQPAQIK